MKTFFLLASLLINYTLFSQPIGYSFGKQILIESSEVVGASDLIDFPILINIVDADLRTVANGGNVENSNGYDIIFTEGDCFTELDHQIEKYDPSTGELIVWVKIPILPATVDKGIHMYYGNALISVDPSSTATWSAGYDGVWHLHDDFLDASGNGNNGVNNGSNDLSPAYNSGDGQNFVDPNDWIELPSHPSRGGSYSYSGWFRTNDRTRAGQRIFCDDQSNGAGCHAISLGDPGAGRLRFYIRGASPVSLDSPALISNDVWYYVTITYNSGTGLRTIYLDGTLVASTGTSGGAGAAAGNASIGGEVASGESGNRFHGDLDEIRSYSGVLSADWISTEYNNQNSPATFYTISAEYTAEVLCATLPIELLSFALELAGSNKILINWVTASEINNDYFSLERSNDGVNWELIIQIDGAGYSQSLIRYSAIDEDPYIGVSYYRLKQTDFNGDYVFSNIESINRSAQNNEIIIYPNPTNEIIKITGPPNEISTLKIYNVIGEDITSKVIVKWIEHDVILIDLTNLSSSFYYIKTQTQTNKVFKK